MYEQKGVLMFQTGERVVYGSHGVCEIKETEEKNVDKRQVLYLVLEPLGQPGARYLVPTHNEAAMAKLKKILTREELTALIQSEEIRSDGWIQEEGRRKQIYRELISSGDRKKLMGMVHTLYAHKAEQTSAGRKVHLCDENFLRDAEKLLISEICVVMDMPPEEARQYLRRNL